MVNVPAPGRFAIHKCIVSQRRRSGEAAKIRKDLAQAEQVFRALLDLRPADIALAIDAAQARGNTFMDKLKGGLESIDRDVASAVLSEFKRNRNDQSP